MIGLAAGIDKNALHLSVWEDMGFDFAVIGTVTKEPNPGNPHGRVRPFYNNLGLPNDGIQAVLERINNYGGNIRIGLSIDTGLLNDFYDEKYDLSRVDFVEVNISCPNISPTVKATMAIDTLSVHKNCYLKVAPGMTIENLWCNNLVLSNTMKGYSGPFLKQFNLSLIEKLNKETNIIGCGGILTLEDIQEYSKAGAKDIEIASVLLVYGIDYTKELIAEYKLWK